MPSKSKPLTKTELAAYEAKRDLAEELLQSVREVALGFVGSQFGLGEGFTLRGHGESPSVWGR